MSTSTFAFLEITREAYEEIKTKLIAAGYEGMIFQLVEGEAIIMDGIALMVEEEAQQ